MVKVVITGGSGFVASHLIQRLQENGVGLLDEIQTIDRKAYKNELSVRSAIPHKHHTFDLNDRDQLSNVLAGADLVFHLAREQFDPLLGNNKVADYEKDNLQATKSVVDCMIEKSVGRLIYMGDAYANMPSEDNFGNSEDIHNGEPSNYMLGSYGKAKTRAELYARSRHGIELADGSKMHGLFFRPTVIYGEGSRSVWSAMRQVLQANNDEFPHQNGNSTGFVQYIHAGFLATLMEEAMRIMLEKPEEVSGHYFYCMDKTEGILFHKVVATLLSQPSAELGPARGLASLYTQTALAELRHLLQGGGGQSAALSLPALRLFVIYATGFSNRRQLLMFRARPSQSQEEAMNRTAAWLRDNLDTTPKSVPVKPVERRG